MKYKNIKLTKLKARLASGLFAFAVVTGIVAASSAPVAASGLPGFCLPMDVPISNVEGELPQYKLHLTYCQPTKWSEGRHQVDVVTPGAGYTSRYWNWDQQSSLYSYADKTLAAGRAIVTYDRIGSGDSSKPVSTDVTFDGDAYVLHQLIQALHFWGYSKVNSIGHSYSSAVVVKEAVAYKDVNSIVLTGFLHNPRNPAILTRNYPANQDPMFADSGLDSGYLTSRPGTRASSFYGTSADPAVIAYDEAHKDVIALTAFLGYSSQQSTPAASNISTQLNIPVMLAVGQEDFIFCQGTGTLDCTDTNAVRNYEQPFYANATNFNVYTVPSTGHDIALHPTANQSFQAINNWIKNL